MYILWNWESQKPNYAKGGVTMANGIGYGGNFNGNFFDLLSDLIGETVTIFTTSGGQSGCGFTGVILAVNQCFVRLVTHIGPAPGCALGNACQSPCCPTIGCSGYGGGYGGGYSNVRSVGSVTDIPLDRIVAVVSNAV
jgi:hypothetical protein